jgi:hypothetical protein
VRSSAAAPRDGTLSTVPRALRAPFVLLALGAGCATQTIDLLAPASGGAPGGSSGAAGSLAGTPPINAGGAAANGGKGGQAGAGKSGLSGGRGGATGGATGEAGGDGQGGAGTADCDMDVDCPTSKPHCVEIFGTARLHCVECVAHENCKFGERCNFLINECAPACTTFEDCPFTLPFCERGVCIQCVQDSHCGPNVCVFGRCEECRSTIDCPPSAPVCGESYVCRPCTGMFQCGQYRYCDLATGRCEPF